MKQAIKNFGEWAQANWSSVIIVATISVLLMLFLVIVSWLFGYWANGLFGYHFDLNSVWNGVSVAATAAVSIFGLAFSQNTKYKTDSQYNSNCGQLPGNYASSNKNSTIKTNYAKSINGDKYDP